MDGWQPRLWSSNAAEEPDRPSFAKGKGGKKDGRNKGAGASAMEDSWRDVPPPQRSGQQVKGSARTFADSHSGAGSYTNSGYSGWTDHSSANGGYSGWNGHSSTGGSRGKGNPAGAGRWDRLDEPDPVRPPPSNAYGGKQSSKGNSKGASEASWGTPAPKNEGGWSDTYNAGKNGGSTWSSGGGKGKQDKWTDSQNGKSRGQNSNANSWRSNEKQMETSNNTKSSAKAGWGQSKGAQDADWYGEERSAQAHHTAPAKSRGKGGPQDPSARGKGKSKSKQAEEEDPDDDEDEPAPSRQLVSKDFITKERFADLALISPESQRGIREVLGYEFLTVVQSATLPAIAKGTDCLAKAKTGTGKTLAFLIPTVEILRKVRKGGDPISSLVLSPTRELAAQITKEAEALTRFQKMNVVCVIGGTNINKDKSLLSKRVDVLVATPGRMGDHLDNTAGIAERCSQIKVLIFDEADQLLEMGFKPAIDKILAYMPDKKDRQTLLFSATVPASVRQIADQALSKGYATVDTVGEEEEQTHEHVRQQLLVLPVKQQIAGMAAVLSQFTKEQPYKIIVFFTTARVAGFMAELFNTIGLSCPVLEIHSRKSQAQRTKTSEVFRKPGNKILFSSDVSARGMDYPDVTHVLQVGLTDREQYIHRLGRTARAGKSGQGLLLLAPFEERSMLRDLSDMKLERLTAQSLDVAKFQGRCDDSLWHVQSTLRDSAEKAFSAWLGFYNSNLKKCGWDKVKLVQEANAYALTIGLQEPPLLE
eukprot:CAMPEP_0178391400 /NCGR_PEP_ID=MMETSP0689_2-20121128/11144_1 /TAXON_ID=160604 /ORGANISM="Amphidinium massartii, Strain CS-259" /LENGTH=759 /DNA_ID=CAMNT_0020011943 /DNA_START=51 /DNA_END=2327 /DNA_ORIENTATION=+